jgi:hypothetical protein
MAPQKPSAKATKVVSRKAASNAMKVRKTKDEKFGKPIFKGMTFSFSGDFGDGWEHEKMAKWVRHHAGVWQSEVSDDTTHLICTIGDYKKKTQQGLFYPDRERRQLVLIIWCS